MFKITKDLSPEKITGYTYQDQPIVLARKRGRPPRTKAKPGWHPLDKKIHAACIYAVTGDLKKACELTDIPVNQLKSMMNEQWWIDAIQQIRREENDQITAKMTTIVDKSLDAMQDRLENGDSYLTKDGEIVKVPVRMKDLTMPVGILTDKRQLLRGEATSRTEKLGQEDILKELANKFESFAKQLNHKQPETIDVSDAEVITEEKIEDVRSE
jgi:hypothetical protein